MERFHQRAYPCAYRACRVEMVSVSAHAASPRQSARSSTNLRASRQSSWRTQRQRNVDSLTPGTGRGRRLGGDNPDSGEVNVMPLVRLAHFIHSFTNSCRIGICPQMTILRRNCASFDEELTPHHLRHLDILYLVPLQAISLGTGCSAGLLPSVLWMA
eukprot:SAG31_NODE_97_length_25714_cov_19.477142_12_plen_158_part_00